MGDNSIVAVVAAASTNLCVSDSIPGTGSNTWIIDTGASDHMTYDAKFFDELSSNTRDPYITSANGLPSPITGEGTISLTPTMSLSRALLVPNIHCNLLSVGRLLDTLNASATFYPTHCSFQDLKTHEMIGHGKRIGGLYYLTLPSAPIRDRVVNTVQSCSVKDKQQIWLWHHHLGHPSFGYLKRLFPSLFHSCDESSFKCETCILAKSHRTVFPLSDSKAAKPFDLVHSDVWGLARVTSNGFRWFVTFIDDCTRLTWVFLLKNKHDVASILPEFCTMVSTQFHAQVKVFRTDNGGEYVNNTLASFFLAQGIIHQTTTPFTPQQNGVSERKNRQLLEVARSFMLDMSVPHHLWGHAVLSAAYLINRTPSRVLDFKTPHDVFGDHVSPVSVSKLPLKVFGCVAYVHVYSHQRSKLDPCALRCVFIGYSSTHKGYKCYHPPTQKVHVTLDVTFHEEVPYYVSPSSPIQGERGSELESLGLENDVFEDTALRKETTYRTKPSDRLHIYEDGTCGPCEETSDHPLELDRSPISEDEVGALGVETIGHTEASNQSPVSENNDSDSCMDEFDAIPLSALPVPQSTRDSESSEHKADGSIDRYKARLVAKGYTQTYGVDYLETFAPVAKLNTVRVLLSLAANHDWPLLQFDVKNAFLHGDLKEEIYMDLPPGISVTSQEGKLTALIIYVDDMIVTGDDQAEMQNLQKYLASEFEMKSLGDLKYFLGIEVARSKHGIFLFQRKYILDLLAETGMLDCKPIDTPSEQNHKLGLYPDQVPTDKERYQRLVGKLIYLSHTRPDIAYAVSVVSQFMHSPSEDHMGAVMRILSYLKVTPGKGLMFCKYGHTDVEGYTDADWAGSVTDRCSTSGYFTFVGGNLVTWRSKKQKVVSRSSAEAEYRGMAQGVCELL
ncbi:unnamed protein product [Prunus brigantina]